MFATSTLLEKGGATWFLRYGIVRNACQRLDSFSHYSPYVGLYVQMSYVPNASVVATTVMFSEPKYRKFDCEDRCGLRTTCQPDLEF